MRIAPPNGARAEARKCSLKSSEPLKLPPLWVSSPGGYSSCVAVASDEIDLRISYMPGGDADPVATKALEGWGLQGLRRLERTFPRLRPCAFRWRDPHHVSPPRQCCPVHRGRAEGRADGREGWELVGWVPPFFSPRPSPPPPPHTPPFPPPPPTHTHPAHLPPPPPLHLPPPHPPPHLSPLPAPTSPPHPHPQQRPRACWKRRRLGPSRRPSRLRQHARSWISRRSPWRRRG